MSAASTLQHRLHPQPSFASTQPTHMHVPSDEHRYHAVTRANCTSLPQWNRLPPELQEAVKVVSLVFPFKTNRYVTDHLIDWSRVPDDPIFQLTFPQKGMLQADDYAELLQAMNRTAATEELKQLASRIQDRLNPHPSGQATANLPILNGRPVHGMQHKYLNSVLFFPQQGQTCHAYCTFCFRWPQFIGRKELQIASTETSQLVEYLNANPHVTDVIFTGGDPLIMRTATLKKYLEPLLKVETIQSIRIGSKSLAYWPQRFVTDSDADDLIELFERIVASGKQLALMAHTSHPVELSSCMAEFAVRRIRGTGAVIRSQGPVLRHINDDPQVWAELWRKCCQLGIIPYYMFVERDTGPRGYFEMPLVRGWEIFTQAFQQVPGIARTVRGPVMSCFPGKCHVLGMHEVMGEQAFVLEFLQSRQPEMVRRPFFAKYDPHATWFDQLRPFGPSDAPYLSAT
ncbi:MAG: hypothetical protein KDA61_10120 [Planctomycetales bacterium]|nr:hypothetical protein [Planctomycetales bacterium]